MGSPRAMHSIAFYNGSAWVSLANGEKDGTEVLRAALPLPAAAWVPAGLGNCAVGRTSEHEPARAPGLRALDGTLWLFQPWHGAQEHSLCALDAQGTTFVPKDQALRVCNQYYCSTLWMTDLKMSGNRMFTNAGAGLNVFVSDDKAANWRVLLGDFDEMTCYHASFLVVGDRLLAGGECPLDDAYLRAYQLTSDGARLASTEPLPLTVPELENRNIQFIETVAGTSRVFVGTEGGLLRSDDGGKSFKFVVHHPLSGSPIYPYISQFLSPANKPNMIVVGGFDKANAKPYLAWSADGGDKWTDLSAMLPGYLRATGGQVTALAEDPQGRLYVVVNEEETAKGHLMRLTLGKP